MKYFHRRYIDGAEFREQLLDEHVVDIMYDCADPEFALLLRISNREYLGQDL